ncbi:hypothetical protein AB6A40_007731 [Gnathostoma spinigerum]|uniref:RING-type domain-containing protein n=1 Tax=Gnathostoma spinigerum TaxID=75299 RepID=A0ABD6EWR7_9BILA
MTKKNVQVGDEYRILLKALNPHITCPICKGYFVEATTVIDCLHTFCKSCLLKHFENVDNCCPKCHNLIHQSHPSHYVSFDRTMQELVYKLVPGLQAREMAQRCAFEATRKKGSGSNNDQTGSADEVKKEVEKANCEGDPLKNHHRNDDHLNVHLITDKMSRLDPVGRSFIRLPEMATVNTIKRYIAGVLFGDMGRYNEIDIFCNNELMGRDFSMKFIEKTRWRNKPKKLPIATEVVVFRPFSTQQWLGQKWFLSYIR